MSRGLFLGGVSIFAIALGVIVTMDGGLYILYAVACVCVCVVVAGALKVALKIIETRPQGREVPAPEWKPPKRERERVVAQPQDVRQVIL